MVRRDGVPAGARPGQIQQGGERQEIVKMLHILKRIYDQSIQYPSKEL